jgi:hypothetical protein
MGFSQFGSTVGSTGRHRPHLGPRRWHAVVELLRRPQVDGLATKRPNWVLLPDDCEKDLAIVGIVPIIGPVSKSELNRDNDSCLVDRANIQLHVEVAEMMVVAREYSAMNPVRIAVACVTGAGIVTVTFWVCGPEPDSGPNGTLWFAICMVAPTRRRVRDVRAAPRRSRLVDRPFAPGRGRWWMRVQGQLCDGASRTRTGDLLGEND